MADNLLEYKSTREEWLVILKEKLRPKFISHGLNYPKNLQISFSRLSKGTNGLCVMTSKSTDPINVYLSDELSDPIDISKTFIHELIHAVLPLNENHGKLFKSTAELFFLEPNIYTSRTNKFDEWIGSIIDTMPKLIYRPLIRPLKMKGVTPYALFSCSNCINKIYMLKKLVIDIGIPDCSYCRNKMEVGNRVKW